MLRLRLWSTLLLTALALVFQSDEKPPLVQVRVSIVNAATRAPIADATVTAEGAGAALTDGNGRRALTAPIGSRIGARAPGFLRGSVDVHGERGGELEIALTPFRPRALYLSVYGINDRKLRTDALAVVATTTLNAVVIDMKGDRGIVSYSSRLALANQVAVLRGLAVADLPALLRDLRSRGIYSIARVVVFKDDRLAQARGDLALHTERGALYRDEEGLAWTNPYSREVWDYNIGIAKEAAAAGFDEVQFDYLRFPDARGIAYERPWTQPNREAAIEGFLRAARQALEPYNVFLAADVFGYTCWNPDDTRIGQNIEHMAALTDYLSPMLYPSGFQFGIPGYRNPVEHPHEIVQLSLEQARRRTNLPAVRFRPWLQAFRDYAFGGRQFGPEEIGAQVSAAEHFGADGWMLWNSRNQYAAADVQP